MAKTLITETTEYFKNNTEEKIEETYEQLKAFSEDFNKIPNEQE